jgi:N-acetylmuramate 1-kinase
MKSKTLPIPGDASFRNFYRVISNKKSKIIVIAKKEKYKNLAAYTAVNQFLRKNKILAPKLLDDNYKKGNIVIEDFGNLSYYGILKKQKNKIHIYKKLVNNLLKIQKIKTKKKIKGVINKVHLIEKYSLKILSSESDLFFNWYLPLFLKKKDTLNIKKKLRKILLNLYKKLNFPNYYFVHRDYHSQNLMKVGNKIGVIDTQDALRGNPAYDLVSLIDDVRIKTSKNLKDKIYRYYLKKSILISKKNQKLFGQDFNILSVQRSMKIIGIFARLYKRDKKKKYLKFIPYTWKLLEMRMQSKDFLDLKKILNNNVKIKIRKKVNYK